MAVPLPAVIITINDGDQDNDQLLSSIELSIGLDPNDADTDDNGTNDGAEDFDNDGFTNAWVIRQTIPYLIILLFN